MLSLASGNKSAKRIEVGKVNRVCMCEKVNESMSLSVLECMRILAVGIC